MKYKIIFTFMSLVMTMSISFSYFGEGKALASEIEEKDRTLEAVGDIELVYDLNGNFLGLDEDSLEVLKGTEYEYIINDLRNEGLLVEEDGLFNILTNGQVSKE